MSSGVNFGQVNNNFTLGGTGNTGNADRAAQTQKTESQIDIFKKKYDKDGNGKINKQEGYAAIQGEGGVQSITSPEVKALLQEAGINVDDIQTLNTVNGQTTIEYKNGNAETLDKNGNKLSETIKEGAKTTTTTYDTNGNKKEVKTEENNVLTTETYDSSGNIESTTRKKGQVTEFLDSNGRVTKKETNKGPAKEIVEFEYDGDSTNVKKETKTNMDGSKNTVEYDKENTKGVVVQNGESPAEIANKFGVSKEALISANKGQLKGTAPNQYFIAGANITIPRKIDAGEFSKLQAGRLDSEGVKAKYKNAMEAQQAKAGEQANMAELQQLQEQQSKLKEAWNEGDYGAQDIAHMLKDGYTARSLNKVNSENAAQVILAGHVQEGMSFCGEILSNASDNSDAMSSLSYIWDRLENQAQATGISEKQLEGYRAEFLKQKAQFKEDNPWFSRTRAAHGSDFDKVFVGLSQSIKNQSLMTGDDIQAVKNTSFSDQQSDMVKNMTTNKTITKAAVTDNKHTAAKFYDWMKTVGNSDNTMAGLDKKFESYQGVIDRLNGAQNQSEFEAIFKEEFGIEYNANNMKAFNEISEQFAVASTLKSEQDYFQESFSLLLSEKPLEAEIEYITIPGNAFHGPTKMANVVTVDRVVDRELNNLASFIGNGNVEEGTNIIKYQVAAVGGNWNAMSAEDKFKVLQEVASFQDEYIGQCLNKATNGVGYDEMSRNFDSKYQAAFGTQHDIGAAVQKYNISQATGEEVLVTAGKTAVSIGALFVPGGPLAAGAIAGGGSILIDLTNTRDVKEVDWKGAGIDAVLTSATMGLGKAVEGAKAISKLEQISLRSGTNAALSSANEFMKTGKISASTAIAGALFNKPTSRVVGKLIKASSKAAVGSINSEISRNIPNPDQSIALGYTRTLQQNNQMIEQLQYQIAQATKNGEDTSNLSIRLNKITANSQTILNQLDQICMKYDDSFGIG